MLGNTLVMLAINGQPLRGTPPWSVVLLANPGPSMVVRLRGQSGLVPGLLYLTSPGPVRRSAVCSCPNRIKTLSSKPDSLSIDENHVRLA